MDKGKTMTNKKYPFVFQRHMLYKNQKKERMGRSQRKDGCTHIKEKEDQIRRIEGLRKKLGHNTSNSPYHKDGKGKRKPNFQLRLEVNGISRIPEKVHENKARNSKSDRLENNKIVNGGGAG